MAGSIIIGRFCLQGMSRVLEYSVPAEMRSALVLGSCVRVPYRNKTVLALFLGLAHNSTVAHTKIRAVKDLVEDAAPYSTGGYLAFMERVARYYHVDIAQVLRLSRPAVVYAEKSVSLFLGYKLVVNNAVPGRSSAALRRLYQWLVARDSAVHTVADVTAAGFSSRTLLALARHGLLEQLPGVYMPSPKSKAIGDDSAAEKLATVQLTGSQQAVVEKIKAVKEGYQWHLLDGVTGSGKSLIYIELCRYWLGLGRQVLWLVPEIGLTSQILVRLKALFATDGVELWHSGLSERERILAWRRASGGSAGLLVATRSGLFLPLPSLGAIIIDEEHDSSYKQQSGLRYSARGVAFMRAQAEGLTLVLGSATPSLAMLRQRDNASGGWHKLTERFGSAGMPRVHMVDMRTELSKSGLAVRLLERIREQLSANKPVMLFINRRGFSPRWWCAACAKVRLCEGCDRPLSYHQHAQQLRCHRCDINLPLDRSCTSCGVAACKPLGYGTEKIGRYLSELFAGVEVLQVDRDTCGSWTKMQSALSALATPKARLIVATQMMVKSHNIPRLDCVVVMDVDAVFSSKDFRAEEQTLAQLHQVIGRAGRGGTRGDVYIQTFHVEQAFWKSILEHDYHAGAAQLLAKRSAMGLPPYSHHAVIKFEASCEQKLQTWVKKLYAQISSKACDQVAVFSPFASYIAKKNQQYSQSILLQSGSYAALHQLIIAAHALMKEFPVPSAIRYHLDMDPLDW